MKRAAIIVLDGLGIGPCPDQAAYGDAGSDTLGNVAHAVGGLRLPNLERLGLGKCRSIPGLSPAVRATAAHGVALPRSQGKDSTTGHWELMGVTLARRPPTYPGGFPPEVVGALEEATGRGVLGNAQCNGVEAIQRFGEEHLRTGELIVYTSQDSVMQICAHVDVVAPDELYAACAAARELMTGEHAVGRVIARPFEGPAGGFVRTLGRRDFALPPPSRWQSAIWGFHQRSGKSPEHQRSVCGQCVSERRSGRRRLSLQ